MDIQAPNPGATFSMPHIGSAVPNPGLIAAQKRLGGRSGSVFSMPETPVPRPDGDPRWGDPYTIGEPPIEHVLAAYGTLQPGESNFDVVGGVDGLWYRGLLRGRRFINPGGHYKGYPAFESVPTARPSVAVSVLVSSDLPAQWARLDEFEGTGYRRVPILVELAPNAAGGDAGVGADLVVIRAYVYETVPHPA